MKPKSIENLIGTDRGHVVHPFSALFTQANKELAVFESADGVWLTNPAGERFLDAAGGLWCANVGYGRQEIVDAAAKQMQKMSFLHSFSNFAHGPQADLTDRLLSLLPSGFERIFYGLSGSDANDTNVKLVWRYNNVLGRPQKKKIIGRLSGYHGSTVIAGSLTGISAAHRTFDLPRPGFLHTHAADWHRRPDGITDEEQYSTFLAEELDRMIVAEGPETVAAFIAEPVVGSGGIIPPPRGYFAAIQKVLERHDVLFIADEVITAFGRTGRWFASPHYGIRPDLLTISKGLTSSYLPMSASIISDRVSRVLYRDATEDGAFGHGFTSSGHPVCAAAALANIDIIEREKLPENAADVGTYLLAQLQERLGGREFVSDVRGAGLMVTVEFDRDKITRTPFRQVSKAGSFIIQACYEQKLIIRGARGRVLASMAPPLILTRANCDEIVVRLTQAVNKFETAARGGLFD